MNETRIILDPKKREKYLANLLKIDGLSHLHEQERAAYCPISLTSTPENLKPILKERQDILMNKVLAMADIKAYDPASAPYSPDKNLVSNPDEVYLVDSSKIVSARFFVGHILFPSTGFGIEAEKAKIYNRISVYLVDKNIRISRMQPNRAIYLQYNNFRKEYNKFVEVFKILDKYCPGIGVKSNRSILLGFHKTKKEIVNLEELIYSKFPDLRYRYSGKVDTLKLKVENIKLIDR